jgi:outer membrane receptor protein involved in Fe transport
MRKELLLLLFLCGFGINLLGQGISVSGLVVETNGSMPLFGATVSVFRQNDSVLLCGTVSDSAGLFRLNAIPRGNYFIEISFIGFKSDTISHIKLVKDINLGMIKLQPSKILLGEVRVSGEKSLIIDHLDKKVYNVGKDVFADASSAIEILQNIPSVTVGINGGITLRNTANITFFINGKPSALMRRKASAVLQQIPASTIKRIEVITNPSAKYRPDGVGGIINIILKKGTKQGMNGEISAHVGTEQRENASVNLNYATKTFKIYGNYSIRHSNGAVLYTDNRIYKDSLSRKTTSYYHEKGSSTTNVLAHNFYAGLNYKINKYNNLELSGSYFHQRSLHNGDAGIHALDTKEKPLYSFTNNPANNELEEEGEIDFSYDHVFKNNEDHTLSVEANRSAYNEKEDKWFHQLYTFPGRQEITNHYISHKSGKQEEVKVDYTLPTGENGTFESGYSGEFIFDDINYFRDAKSSRFLFQQQINALYVLYGHSFDKFSFQAGLRAEQVFVISHLAVPKDSLYSQQYFKLFPTFHLGFEISDKMQITLSYSKRINRPDADGMNPNPEYSDPRNAEAGNPYLKPEQFHSIELGYLYKNKNYSVTSALYYRYKYDAFTGIFTNIGDSVVMYTTVNLNTQQSAGVETTLSGHLFHLWNYNLTADVFYTTLDASTLGYSNKSSISGSLKGYSLFKIANSTFIQSNAYYYFPSITPQGKRKPYFYCNIGFKQNLFKNKATITLTGTDIFHTYKINYQINSSTMNQTTSIMRRLPVFYLGFVWRFNNYKDKEKLKYEENGLKK